MKTILIIVLSLMLMSCKGGSSTGPTPTQAPLNTMYNHEWYYGQQIRNANAYITKGSSYTLSFSSDHNSAYLRDASINLEYRLILKPGPTSDSFLIIANWISQGGTVIYELNETWTYAHRETERQLDICVTPSSCITFTR